MAVRVSGLETRQGDTAQAFVVLRFASACDRAAATAMLRGLGDVTGQDDAAIDEWMDGLADDLQILAVPWEPPATKKAATAQRTQIDATAAYGVEAVWCFQVGTSLPDVDDDDLDDDGDEAGWSHGLPPEADEVRFGVDGYPEIIDELDWEDFGIAVKLAGPAVPGQDVVLSAFHSLWLSPYAGRFRNGAVTFDRAHNAAHFWVDRFASPTSAAEQVHHLLWVMSQLDTVLPIVHARFAEASMTQKFSGLMGEAREPFVLGGNPLLGVYADDGDAGIDSWLEVQTDWADDEIVAMLRELAIDIVTTSDDEGEELDDDGEDEPGADALEADEDDNDLDDGAGTGRQITGYAGDLLRERAAAGCLHPRAAERLLPVLESPERYEQRRQAVVDVLAALQYRPAVPALIRILEVTSIRSSLDSISKSALVASTATALGAIGDTAAIPALARVVAAPGTHNDAARATAADALASCLQKTPEPRQVDDAVLGELLTMICERNDGELNAESHFAYGRLVRLLPPDRRADARRKLADADTARDDAIAMLARQAALLLASPTSPVEPPPRDLQPLLRESLTTLDYDHEYTVRNLRVALRVAEVVPELVDPDDVVWLTRFAEADIRRSAHALLATLGKPLAEAPAFDRLSVRGLADDELVRLISEPHVVGRAALITEACLRRLDAAKHPVINACHDVIARARQGGENLLDPDTRVLEAAMPFLREPPLDADVIALFERMLRHTNVHVKWEIVEDAPRDERLIAAMFHVLGEKWGWQEDAARRWLARFRGTPAYEAEHARAGAPPEPDPDPAAVNNPTSVSARSTSEEDMN
jgi:hypothetical protein